MTEKGMTGNIVNKDKSAIKTERVISQSLSQTASTLATIAGGLLAVATIMGFCLHLSGDVAYSTYLTGVGVQPTSFPQAADWKIIHGYYVTVVQGIRLLGNIPWRIVLTMIGLSTFAIVMMRAPVKENPQLRAWLQRQSYWVRESIITLIGMTVFLSAAAGAGCFILILAIVPGLAAEKYGKAKADDTNQLMQHEKAEEMTELWKEDKRLLRGHVITTNNDLIAVYDADLKTTRTLLRDGIEIRTPLPISKKSITDSPDSRPR
ncbi:hypothetical protein VDG62_06255 [Xanthomonas campestris pv. raphani]|uniref:hypothetical protein n=2 Tax=Xanthomonas campestris TaxID=339 RepID=UPI001E547E6C|nr:hypothetical protein [Xanthomonas campestris]MCC8487600.1 hypothetical protein [Xanthomonas campestris]MEA9744181.1 hypothetical protein [Xanthomonas campestris pv. raphani]MEA9867801.1 hypothetical protein [Xanthomonas campestris pv. raphani]